MIGDIVHFVNNCPVVKSKSLRLNQKPLSWKINEMQQS